MVFEGRVELRELVGLTGPVLSVPVSSSAGSSVAGGSMFLVPGGLRTVRMSSRMGLQVKEGKDCVCDPG
ncbi:hypothetical protein BD408DRAFT_431478 [Parasitella parasitica]|nr:hypothetical protein BD408DRAFT_431478 [Parasitella parasitica]